MLPAQKKRVPREELIVPHNHIARFEFFDKIRIFTLLYKLDSVANKTIALIQFLFHLTTIRQIDFVDKAEIRCIIIADTLNKSFTKQSVRKGTK